ncbi:sensor histidine kinase NtrY-like [Sphingomonas morindae]|uniref:histidine kinase n=1 Tax=Sphingomonas morindae TaxID=1541170 RepID=A0ABY4X7Y5_9SPHN|nr:ATP-binding protein [Sphingomonas morindae]USI72979.1 HAMP domain-containing protein [Sphingomonas morindae]
MMAKSGGSSSLPTARLPRWRRRLALVFRRGSLFGLLEGATLIAAALILAGSWALIRESGSPERQLSPPLVALLLVGNLVPLIGVMVLLARRVARRRAGGAGGRLHVRLVALFSLIAAIPTLFVVIFASLLFQYGVSFWFSDKARTVLESADRVAQSYVAESIQRLDDEMVPMASDFRDTMAWLPVDDPKFSYFLAQQYSYRHLNELALIGLGPNRAPYLLAFTNLNRDRPVGQLLPEPMVAGLSRGKPVTTSAPDRIESHIVVNARAGIYLYASRRVDPLVLKQASRASSAIGDYRQLIERSRLLQLQFNAALFLLSLLIVAAAIWIAFTVADRITRPITGLMEGARRITLGDLSVRVPAPKQRDEIGVLATAFNRMTRRLEEQTGALVAANRQLDARRALTEAVLRGVSAGVLSVDRERRVRLLNRSAEALLAQRDDNPVGRPLAEIAPELDPLIDAEARDAVVQFASAGDMRTLAVTVLPSADGYVLTFDDITQQLLDQRRAAWSDVARRIAHEIKNPLTPIQLAAERLQRRYGREVQSDPAVFERLTQTIVRQVGDLRRMVDEFSSFARMPKPVFKPEPIVDVARQALFLHEVAHPGIRFDLAAPDPSPILVCDRRLLGQGLTNVVKNAVEAIVEKPERGAAEHIAMAIVEEEGRIAIEVADTGIGLPAERERLTEPYMTTRAGGTGLGLAIVRKIVEEHFGTISFRDRPGGGTIVRILLDPATLAPLAGEGGDGDEERALPELTRMKAV